jgi:two-component system, LytTR family, response regulator
MTPLDKRSARIHALVVDDESLARRNLTVLLREDPDIASVAECESGLEAIEQIRKSKPDLVFLDVQMPECGGFDLLELLGSDLSSTIIFVTAYDKYALRAFEAGALDYLLKPFDDARFARALNRAKDRLAHYARSRPGPAERLVVKSRGQALFLNVADVDWIEAAGYYACVHVGADTHIIRRTLLELERDLGDEAFIRIHRSIIVNLDRIRGLELQSGGEYEVVLKSRVRLQVSRRFRKRLQDRMGAMSGRDLQAAEKKLEVQRFAQLKEHRNDASAVAARRVRLQTGRRD